MKYILTTVLCTIVLFTSTNAQDYRKNTDVTHYTLDLRLFDFSKSNLSGTAALWVKARTNDASEIKLDLTEGLTVQNIQADGKNIRNFVQKNDLLTIPYPLSLTDTTHLVIYYSGKPARDKYWGGFFFTDTHAFNMGVGMAADPQSFGRAWFPCIDDFEDRATYEYYLTCAEAHTAVACGTLQSVTDNGDKTHTFHWTLSSPVPAYLSAIAVSEYVTITDSYTGISGNQVPVSIYIHPQDEADARKSLEHLPDMFNAFEYRYGPYVWERLGIVSVPFSGGAMEHATNIACSKASFDGTYADETLFAHELSHHWFGDLVTCKTASDMWLNEGWASFCEGIFIEYTYGIQAAKEYQRNNAQKVLRRAHIRDEGYFAVSGVSHALTYGSTVYEKGAMVAQTLRGYLGDSLFFGGMKAYLQAFAWSNASSDDLCDFLSQYTGVDLNPFFDAWVYTPGFPHFSVQQMQVDSTNKGFKVELSLVQKLVGRTTFSKHNRIELTFVGKQWQQETRLIEFSGERYDTSILLNFKPVCVITDLNEKIADATTDCALVIKDTKLHEYKETYFKARASELADSAWVHVTHNWVAADSMAVQEPAVYVSKRRYWDIAIVKNEDTRINGFFYYDQSGEFSPNGYLDDELIKVPIDNLQLLYRPTPQDVWTEVSFVRQGSYISGELLVENIQPGQYVLAVSDWDKYNDEHPKK